MRTLYLECNMGAAGDMIMSALLELIDHSEEIIERMNGLGLKDVRIQKERAVKCGITGTKVNVYVHGTEERSNDVYSKHDYNGIVQHVHNHIHSHSAEHSDLSHKQVEEHIHEHTGTHHSHNTHKDSAAHHHSGMKEILDIINHLSISEKVKKDAAAIYTLIAEAEAKAHGKTVTQVHFHEVGSLDAIADVVGACILMEELKPDRVVVSPIHVGSGFVRCAHGVLPIPAPATAHILLGVPTYGGQIQGELCTPTGAAILKYFADSFGQMPIMSVNKIGYGMGSKDFEAANCIRAFLGSTANEQCNTNWSNLDNNLMGSAENPFVDAIVELSCNLDDMTGEALGYLVDLLLKEGALDVFNTPIQMKKNRPAVMLTCLSKTEDSQRMAALILKHTTTFGVRQNICQRYILKRDFRKVNTEYGEFQVKIGEGYGINKIKPEFDEIAAAANKYNVSISEIYQKVIKEISIDGN